MLKKGDPGTVWNIVFLAHVEHRFLRILLKNVGAVHMGFSSFGDLCDIFVGCVVVQNLPLMFISAC